jgi:TM2 domain-containing membrane protein YozV
MRCSNCGQENQEGAKFCVKCGKSIDGSCNGTLYCSSCGKENLQGVFFCAFCGASIGAPQGNVGYTAPTSGEAKSKLAAGLLGVFIGGFGIHRFYLGYVGIGIAQIIVTICTCGVGHIWGFIEGILILVGSIDKDAQGKPLKE